ncbi:hypothetical protein WOLCODRAFT_35207, partial [Wolfiporia cocos MD-104 SS10]
IMGVLIHWMLMGMLILQVYLYYLLFPKDHYIMKIYVYSLFIFETVESCLIMADSFDIFVYGYGNISSLTSYHNTWFSVPIMSALSSAAVQTFFAWRIWKFSNSRLLVVVI